MTDKDGQKIRTRRFLFLIILFFFFCGLIAVYYSTIHKGGSKKGILKLHGWVEGTEVSLSAKLKGQVIKLNAEESSEVQIGDLIAQIDSEQIKSQIANADAQITESKAMLTKSHNHVEILQSRLQGTKIALDLSKKQSKAKIKQAEASLASTRAVLKQAETNYAKAEKDYIRFSVLLKKDTISQSKMDIIEETYKITNSEVEKATREVMLAKASLSLAKSSLTEIRLRENNVNTLGKELIAARTDENIAKAVVESTSAKKNEIEANMDDTFIYSPVKGTVIDKLIELGENVVQGTPLAVIVDMSQLYVKNYVEQHYIGRVKLNDPCRIYVDSFPNRYFEGRVILVASKAEFTPRDVQMNEHRSSIVYKIKVMIHNPGGILKPGMPADVDLKWDGNQPWR